ncbi:MAG: class I SAM-dependent methyltransferase [Myxococcaceae bacterium]
MSAEHAKEQVRVAIERRKPLLESGIEALRLFDRVGDGIPRLVIEQYGAAVRITGGPEHSPLLEPIREALGHPRELFWRFGHACVGGPVGDDGRRVVSENGLAFEVRLLPDLHTGLFLEARPLRSWVRAHAEGRRVLNLFAYTCGFGVAAAAGGARSTTNIDAVPSALARGRTNYEQNGLRSDGRTFWKSDVFAALKQVKAQGGRFDGIVLHPPPVTTGGGRGRRTDPVRDLQKLTDGCRAVLEPDGWLLLAWTASAPSEQELDDAVGLGEPFWTGSSGEDFIRTPVQTGLRARAYGRP